MQISFSDKCFKIKEKKVNLIIGPVADDSAKTEVKIISEDKTFIINAPGDYEFSGVSIFNTDGVYIGEIDETKFCYLSKLNFDLSDRQLEEVDGIDLLFIVLYKDDIGINKAIQTIKKIQPKILIAAGDEMVNKFFKDFGYESVKREKKLVINKLSLPKEMEALVLENKNG